MDLGKAEGVLLPRREQSRAEIFNPGERVRVVITRVSRTVARSASHRFQDGPVAPRAACSKIEVPEIYEGTVRRQECGP